jgi:hypothetical protein
MIRIPGVLVISLLIRPHEKPNLAHLVLHEKPNLAHLVLFSSFMFLKNPVRTSLTRSHETLIFNSLKALFASNPGPSRLRISRTL